MNVCFLPTTPSRRLLVAAVFLMSASLGGCSFDSSGTPASCEEEGARQNGFVCRDGVWEVGEDGSDRIDVITDDTTDDTDPDDVGPDGVGPDDSGPDDTGDSDVTPDSCDPKPEREYCNDRGVPCQTIEVDDPCVGRISIDCSVYINFDDSLEHCGECDNLCTGGPNATPVCDTGSCTQQCDSGWIDVNGDATDGCEVACQPSNEGVETCDGADNDCDGLVDEADADDATTYYADFDDDGYGDPAVAETACTAPTDFVENSADCDDSDVQITPDADEVCDGTIDENCNGTVDEECPCTVGETRQCGTDQGVCQFGQQTCNSPGTWGGCNGGLGGSSEVCDGQDNDCDGQTDEDFSTKGDACSAGTGECLVTGQFVCSADGNDVECNATATAGSNELCDGLDNDCDGVVDNGFGEKGDACTVGAGACERGGTLVCSGDGSTTVCNATAGTSSPETCGNGVDDDCDGQTDEGCQCNYDGDTDGVCVNGVPDNNGGCDAPTTYEMDESLCDSRDNDCDGVTDEGCQCNFDNTSTGVCSDGAIDDQGFCVSPGAYADPETICDGLDNDCDGQTDEGCDDDGDGYCDADLTVIGSPAICPESAPNTADDCDDASDVTYPGAAGVESTTSCRRDFDQDGYGDENPPAGVTPGADCDDGDPYTYAGAPEICDEKDNDCNGFEFDGSSSTATTFCDQLTNRDARCFGSTSGACCELDNDGDLGCDFETRCADGGDNDSDGLVDCDDPDCNNLSCDAGKLCTFDRTTQVGSCDFI